MGGKLKALTETLMGVIGHGLPLLSGKGSETQQKLSKRLGPEGLKNT